jgi:hypothetical protein
MLRASKLRKMDDAPLMVQLFPAQLYIVSLRAVPPDDSEIHVHLCAKRSWGLAQKGSALHALGGASLSQLVGTWMRMKSSVWASPTTPMDHYTYTFSRQRVVFSLPKTTGWEVHRTEERVAPQLPTDIIKLMCEYTTRHLFLPGYWEGLPKVVHLLRVFTLCATYDWAPCETFRLVGGDIDERSLRRTADDLFSREIRARWKSGPDWEDFGMRGISKPADIALQCLGWEECSIHALRW